MGMSVDWGRVGNMARAYGQDLRDRVIEAGLTGPSVRQAASRFRVAFSTAIGWVKRLCVEGERSARRQGRPRGSKLDAHREFLLSRLEDEPDLTIQKMQELLCEERGVRASVSTIWAFLDRADQTFKKKSVHACEQERPDVLRGSARASRRSTAWRFHPDRRGGDRDRAASGKFPARLPWRRRSRRWRPAGSPIADCGGA